jgi:hypothetical protein
MARKIDINESANTDMNKIFKSKQGLYQEEAK